MSAPTFDPTGLEVTVPFSGPERRGALAALATLELVVDVQELLAVADLRPAQTAGEREIAPPGGWAHAPVVPVPRR